MAAEEGVLRDLELLSFHSVSKGFFGECGRRGGYVEASNISADARASLCVVAVRVSGLLPHRTAAPCCPWFSLSTVLTFAVIATR